MEKLTLANLPTKIEKLERLSAEFGANIWLKRDDHTGSEVSGNKVRKLEYCVKDALEKDGFNILHHRLIPPLFYQSSCGRNS